MGPRRKITNPLDHLFQDFEEVVYRTSMVYQCVQCHRSSGHAVDCSFFDPERDSIDVEFKVVV